jgi:hypothetical protein
MSPAKDATKGRCEWNNGRITCTCDVLQHWLNGEKAVDFYCMDSRRSGPGGTAPRARRVLGATWTWSLCGDLRVVSPEARATGGRLRFNCEFGVLREMIPVISSWESFSGGGSLWLSRWIPGDFPCGRQPRRLRASGRSSRLP